MAPINRFFRTFLPFFTAKNGQPINKTLTIKQAQKAVKQ
jgi:hypothetical protein